MNIDKEERMSDRRGRWRVIGIGVGVASSQLLSRVQTYLTPQVQPLAIIVAFGVSVLVGVIFGMYPAWRASRLVPVAALRYE